MKKLFVIILVLILMPIAFATSSGSMNFNVHWAINNIITTTMEILPYSGSGTLPTDEHDNYVASIIPLDDSSMYAVCLVKYTTNKKGTHKIEFSATPMENTQTSAQHPYTLCITYNSGFPVELAVNPAELENSKQLVFTVFGSGDTIANIFLDAVLTGLDLMEAGNYSSTVTVTEITE